MNTWRQKKRAARAAKKARAQTPARPISQRLRDHDPLQGRSMPAGLAVVLAGGLGVGAIAVHALVIVALLGLNSVLDAAVPDKEDDRIEVTILTPPEPEPEPEPPAKEPEAEPEPKEEVKPPEPEPVPEPPKPKPKPKKKPKKEPEPPPADPINEPEKIPDPPKKPVRRVVGLDSQSTVEGGNGPSFAAGNTRMGVTGDKAENAKKIEKLAPGSKGKPGGTSGTPNKVATRLPTAKKRTRAKMKGGKRKPGYPKALQRRGIEGNVTVRVTIGVDGKVAKVVVVKGSGYKELDTAALAAARTQTWVAQKVGDEKVVSNESYTYRFRISDQ
jgi:periplasmic protein TonB